MSAFAPGQWVRVANVPSDVLPWTDTGMIVRQRGVGDAPVDPLVWLVRFDLLHLERFIAETDLTLLEM